MTSYYPVTCLSQTVVIRLSAFTYHRYVCTYIHIQEIGDTKNEIKSIIISIQNIQFYKIIHNNIIYNEFPYDSEIEFYSQNFIFM